MPYHGLVVYFKIRRFARLEISTSMINTIITEKKFNCLNFYSKYTNNILLIFYYEIILDFLMAFSTVQACAESGLVK